jgi:hypothetical protein
MPVLSSTAAVSVTCQYLPALIPCQPRGSTNQHSCHISHMPVPSSTSAISAICQYHPAQLPYQLHASTFQHRCRGTWQYHPEYVLRTFKRLIPEGWIKVYPSLLEILRDELKIAIFRFGSNKSDKMADEVKFFVVAIF